MIDETEIKTTAGVSSSNPFDSYENFSDEVEVAAGKSVSVEIKAVINPTSESSNINLDLYLRWEDKNGVAAGAAKAALTTFKFVVNGSLTISDSSTLAKKTVALQDNEITVAKFMLKPSKSNSVKLDNLVIDFSKLTTETDTGWFENNVTVEIDGTEVEIDTNTGDATAQIFQYDATSVDDIEDEVEATINVTWLTPKATGDFDKTDAVSVKLISVNGVVKNSEYTRLILPAIVSFESQSSDGAVTKFKVNIDDYDGGQISNLKFYTKTLTGGEGEQGTVSNGQEIEVSNQSTAEVVNKITFTISKDGADQAVELTNTDFPDFFKTTNGTTLRVSKVD